MHTIMGTMMRYFLPQFVLEMFPLAMPRLLVTDAEEVLVCFQLLSARVKEISVSVARLVSTTTVTFLGKSALVPRKYCMECKRDPADLRERRLFSRASPMVAQTWPGMCTPNAPPSSWMG